MTDTQLRRLGVPLREIHYRCQCGETGVFKTRQTALAPLVRLAREDHEGECGDPDIEYVKTRQELEAEIIKRTRSSLGNDFC
jgi:hypothetical protein